MKKKYLYPIIILALIGLSILAYNMKNNKEEIPYPAFLKLAEEGEVVEVNLSDSPQFKAELKDGRTIYTDNPRTEDFKKELLLYGINVKEEGIGINELVIFLVLVSGLVYLLFHFKSNMGKEAEREMSKLSHIEDLD